LSAGGGRRWEKRNTRSVKGGWERGKKLRMDNKEVRAERNTGQGEVDRRGKKGQSGGGNKYVPH